MFKRIGLFLITNLAILFVLSITLRVLGVDSILDRNGGLDLNALLVFAAVFGFGGSFISLAMSKWVAKRAIGAQVIGNAIPGCDHIGDSSLDPLGGASFAKMAEHERSRQNHCGWVCFVLASMTRRRAMDWLENGCVSADVAAWGNA